MDFFSNRKPYDMISVISGVNSMILPEHYENDILFFFDGKMDALTLYQVLFRHIESAFSAASVKVQKTQISFYDKHLFLVVSLPRQKQDTGILVTIGLPYRLESPVSPWRWNPTPAVRPSISQLLRKGKSTRNCWDGSVNPTTLQWSNRRRPRWYDKS